MWILLALIALAVLAPLYGADTRDGLDWTPGHFWTPGSLLAARPGQNRR